MSKYNIMTFDGGGIRGALTARMLRIIKNKKTDIFKRTNLFAGTSTGSLIALGLAAEIDINTLDKLYSEKNGRYIFQPVSSGLLSPRYSLRGLQDILETIFSLNLRLSDLKYKVVITSFKVNKCQNERVGWCPVIFTNLPGSSNQNARVVDVALSSSAAPIYFPSYNNYIDGAVVANNPGSVALSYALSSQYSSEELAKISLISFGTGYYPYYINQDTSSWGTLQWLFWPKPPIPLVTMHFDAAVQTDSLIISQLLGKKYYRFNPLLDKPIGLDDYREINKLKKMADRLDLDPLLLWLQKYW